MKLAAILSIFVFLQLTLRAQSMLDSVAQVLFNINHDTVIVIKKINYSLEPGNLVCTKTYIDSTNRPDAVSCLKAYSSATIKPVLDSLYNIGYYPGTDLSPTIRVKTEVFITNVTVDKTYGNLYRYNLCRNIIVLNDTLHKDRYYNEEQRLQSTKDPALEIQNNIDYQVCIWQSKDKKLLYSVLNSGRPEYGITDGTEYFILTTQIELIKK